MNKIGSYIRVAHVHFSRFMAHNYQRRPFIDFLVSRLNNSPGLVGVEIGTFRAWNAYNILSQLDIKKLYLVDPYIRGSGCNEPEDPETIYRYAKKYLKNFGDKAVFIRKLSENAASLIPNDLDFIYIDGNHDYDFVKKDIEIYFPKVKKKGIIGGHDFHVEFPGVPRAVLEFIDKKHLTLYGKRTDWWTIKIK